MMILAEDLGHMLAGDRSRRGVVVVLWAGWLSDLATWLVATRVWKMINAKHAIPLIDTTVNRIHRN